MNELDRLNKLLAEARQCQAHIDDLEGTVGRKIMRCFQFASTEASAVVELEAQRASEHMIGLRNEIVQVKHQLTQTLVALGEELLFDTDLHVYYIAKEHSHGTH